MQRRAVAFSERREGCRRRQDGHQARSGAGLRWAVAIREDRQKGAPQCEFGGAVEQDGAIGQVGDGRHVTALPDTAGNGALGMEAGVEGRRAAVVTGGGDIGAVGVAAAERAGAMPGGQGDGLVEEEELGVVAGRHHLPVPVLVGERADDPGLVLPARRAEAAVRVVQDAAVAHEEPACGVGNDLARGEDAVLEGHGGFRLVWKRLGEVLSALDSKLRYLLFPTLRLSCFNDEIGFIA